MVFSTMKHCIYTKHTIFIVWNSFVFPRYWHFKPKFFLIENNTMQNKMWKPFRFLSYCDFNNFPFCSLIVQQKRLRFEMSYCIDLHGQYNGKHLKQLKIYIISKLFYKVYKNQILTPEGAIKSTSLTYN